MLILFEATILLLASYNNDVTMVKPQSGSAERLSLEFRLKWFWGKFMHDS